MNALINKASWFANGVAARINVKRKELKWRNEDRKQLQAVDLPELTDAEIKELKKTWPFLKFNKKDVYWARMYKKEYGFDPFFISSVNQMYQLRAKVNPYHQICSLENKAMVDLYLPGVPFPEVYVRCINGNYFDKNMHFLSFADAVDILKDKKCFIIKPALGTMCGNGVKKIDLTNESSVTDEWFKKVFEDATVNFIAQEVITQHTDISRLNPSSLNCCRITSIYVNGIYRYGAMMKIGKVGKHIDNWNSSYIIGINDDGYLKEKGWDNLIQPVYKTDNGILFKDVQYPYFNLVLSSVESYHKKYFPQCGIVGWDIVIDANNKPMVIEANLVIPGIPGEQLCSGPFFKDVRNELCKVFNK